MARNFYEKRDGAVLEGFAESDEEFIEKLGGRPCTPEGAPRMYMMLLSAEEAAALTLSRLPRSFVVNFGKGQNKQTP